MLRVVGTLALGVAMVSSPPCSARHRCTSPASHSSCWPRGRRLGPAGRSRRFGRTRIRPADDRGGAAVAGPPVRGTGSCRRPAASESRSCTAPPDGRRARSADASRRHLRAPRPSPARACTAHDSGPARPALAREWRPAAATRYSCSRASSRSLRAGRGGCGRRGRGRRARPAETAAEVEMESLRPYREGAPASRIHWPTVARFGSLMERRLLADSDSHPLVVLDATRPATTRRSTRPFAPRLRSVSIWRGRAAAPCSSRATAARRHREETSPPGRPCTRGWRSPRRPRYPPCALQARRGAIFWVTAHGAAARARAPQRRPLPGRPGRPHAGAVHRGGLRRSRPRAWALGGRREGARPARDRARGVRGAGAGTPQCTGSRGSWRTLPAGASLACVADRDPGGRSRCP